MNREMFEIIKPQAKVVSLSISSVVASSGKSQVRQAGERNAHVDSLAEEIASMGQMVPVTYEVEGKRSDGTSINRIVEGNHRLAAIKKLYKETKDSRYSTIDAVEKVFTSDYERLEYQIMANNHTGTALKSSVDDAVVVLKHFVFSKKPISGAPPQIKNLHNTSHLNVTDPSSYAKMLKAAIKRHWPDFNSKKVNRIVNRFQTDPQLPGKFQSWDATSLRQYFDDWVESEGVCVGPVDQAGNRLYTILPIKNDNWIDHSLMGLAFRQKTEHGISHKNVAILFWKDIVGKTSKQLDDQRIKMVKKINERNKSPLLRRGTRMIDEIYIAPQKRDGCTEEGFYEIPKTSMAKFSIKQIPDAGWDTITTDKNIAV